jgi:Mg2+ and Co2+ transporter CorA
MQGIKRGYDFENTMPNYYNQRYGYENETPVYNDDRYNIPQQELAYGGRAGYETGGDVSEEQSLIEKILEGKINIGAGFGNKNKDFDLIYFYITIFNYSIETLREIVNGLIKEGDMLQDLYLSTPFSKKVQLYGRVLKHEVNVNVILEELKIKIKFLENLNNRSRNPRKNKHIIKKISFIEFCAQDENEIMNAHLIIKKFKDKFSVFVQSLMGRLLEMEINLKKQFTLVEMVKRTVKIMIDDNHFNNERQLNILIVMLGIFQFLINPMTFLVSWFAVNVRVPMQNYDSLLPFIFICIFIIKGVYSPVNTH